MKKKTRFRVCKFSGIIFGLHPYTNRYSIMVNNYNGTLILLAVPQPKLWESSNNSKPVSIAAVNFFIKDGGYHFDKLALDIL
jgi:hypothetical protein